jgi:hypothetical protein
VISLAIKSERFKNIFVIQEVNSLGIMCVNIYIRGIPKIICVDDYLPFMLVNGKMIPAFAQIGLDGALMGPLIEKVWSKVNGAYERTALGW